VIALEARPSDSSWVPLCDRHGVALVCPETLESLFA
jgi:hypothetical protein